MPIHNHQCLLDGLVVSLRRDSVLQGHIFGVLIRVSRGYTRVFTTTESLRRVDGDKKRPSMGDCGGIRV